MAIKKSISSKKSSNNKNNVVVGDDASSSSSQSPKLRREQINKFLHMLHVINTRLTHLGFLHHPRCCSYQLNGSNVATKSLHFYKLAKFDSQTTMETMLVDMGVLFRLRNGNVGGWQRMKQIIEFDDVLSKTIIIDQRRSAKKWHINFCCQTNKDKNVPNDLLPHEIADYSCFLPAASNDDIVAKDDDDSTSTRTMNELVHEPDLKYEQDTVKIIAKISNDTPRSQDVPAVLPAPNNTTTAARVSSPSLIRTISDYDTGSIPSLARRLSAESQVRNALLHSALMDPSVIAITSYLNRMATLNSMLLNVPPYQNTTMPSDLFSSATSMMIQPQDLRNDTAVSGLGYGLSDTVDASSTFRQLFLEVLKEQHSK